MINQRIQNLTRTRKTFGYEASFSTRFTQKWDQIPANPTESVLDPLKLASITFF